MSLTDTKLRNLRPTGKRYELPDRDGLVLRVSQAGVMAWTVMVRVRRASEQSGQRVIRLAGAKLRVSLGEYPTVSLALARERAAVMRRMARDGQDPRGSKHTRATAKTVKDLIDKFAKDLADREVRSGKNIEKLLRLHVLPVWGDRAISSVGRGDLVELLETLRVPRKVKRVTKSGRQTQVWRGGPGAASEVRRWARSLFQYATDLELLQQNPFSTVRSRDRQRSRSRVLSMEELRAVWRSPTGLIIRSARFSSC